MPPDLEQTQKQGFFFHELECCHPGLAFQKLGLHKLLLGRKAAVIREPHKYTYREKYKYEEDIERVLKAVCWGVRRDPAYREKSWERLPFHGDNYPRLRYQAYYRDRLAAFQAMQCAFGVGSLHEASRLISGNDGKTAMKADMILDYTYGVPIIPGSSVKGACLAAAIQTELLDRLELDDNAPDALPPETRTCLAELLPVTTAGKLSPEEIRRRSKDLSRFLGPDTRHIYGTKESEGSIVFHDAVPCSWNGLEIDVITPHHTRYYAGTEGYENAPDVENPVPVLFLAVPAKTKFLFAFMHRSTSTPDRIQQGGDMALVLEHWKAACSEGFGGKTSSGYGWMEGMESAEPPQLVELDLCPIPPDPLATG